MTTDPTHGLTVQHADALWDAVAIPGPTAPTFTAQHERVCRAVAEILDELAPAVPVSSPPPDQTADRDRYAEVTAATRAEANRLALSEALGLGTGAPWAEIRDRVAVLAVLPPPADRAAVLREAADECDKAGAAYTARALNDHAAGAFALMDAFLRKANEAEYVATPCSVGGCEPGGEPCSTHERLMAHAEGDHELCGPDCGTTDGELRRLAEPETQTEAPDRCPHGCDVSICPCLACEATTDEEDAPRREPHPTEADLRHALAVAAKFHGQDTDEPAAAPSVGQTDEEARPRQSCACGQDGCEYCDVKDADEEAQR